MTNVRPLNRRTALAVGGLTTVAVVAAACGSDPEEDTGADGQPAAQDSAADGAAADSAADSAAGSAADGSSGAAAGGQEIAAVDDIPDGGSVIVGKVLLSRKGDQVKAFSSICTHQGCEIKAAGAEADCPCHGSKFDVTTGAAIHPPATEALATVAVTVSDGKVLQA